MLTRLLRAAGLMFVAAIPSVARVALAASPDVGAGSATESVAQTQTIEATVETAAEIGGQVQVLLSGVVVDSSGSPVAGARATILGPDGADALTDSSGRFDVWTSAPDAGELTLVVEKQSGLEALSAVRTVTMPASEQHQDLGLVTLGGTCEPGWTPGLFQRPPGLDGLVEAVAVFDDGLGDGPALYAGGHFKMAGSVQALYIAKWNGTSWSAVGSGMSSYVNALAVFDDGSGGGPALYAGGVFLTAGGVSANRIAKWNGTSWSALGTGVSFSGTIPEVEALIVFDDGLGGGPALYAGGYFNIAGGVTVNSIAKWDGTFWSALGTGVNNSLEYTSYSDSRVYTLAIFDDGLGGGPALYAGGDFIRAGSVTANGIARWDGSVWSSLGTGMYDFYNQPGVVMALEVFDDGSGSGVALFAGGDFKTAGSVTANAIAKWNGSAWSPLGAGQILGQTTAFVAALEVFDDGSGEGPALFVGGFFPSVDGLQASSIAKWNGSEWSTLAAGVSYSNSTGLIIGAVYELNTFDDGYGSALYAGGLFSRAGGVTTNFIAKWNGLTWSPLGSGIGEIEDGSVFAPVIRAMTIFSDGLGKGPALYAGGEFSVAGGVSASYIGRWDGLSWSALGAGMRGTDEFTYYPSVSALAVFEDGAGAALYAGGRFVSAGGLPANSIAKWNGSSWSPLGTGLNGEVFALAVFNDGSRANPTLCAAGRFNVAGGVTAFNIARWDGVAWSTVGFGMSGGNPQTSTTVQALAVFDDRLGDGPMLYAGGNFTTAGGVPASRIAKWNGVSWAPVGTGMNNTVLALKVFDDGTGAGPALYAGGVFTIAGGVTVNRIAKWNGTTWLPLGTGLNGVVNALAVFDDGSGGGPALYTGGRFTSIAGAPANRIARWNGTEWSTLGTGMNSDVTALTVFDDGLGAGPVLYSGGRFTSAGGVESWYMARWESCSGLPVGCYGDANRDGVVSFDDITTVLGNFGAFPGAFGAGDADGSGKVNFDDLTAVMMNFRVVCTP